MPGPLCRGKELFGKELFGKELFGKELFGKELFGKELFGKELFGKEVFAGAARRPEAVPLPQKRPQEKRHKKAAQLRREVFNLRLPFV